MKELRALALALTLLAPFAWAADTAKKPAPNCASKSGEAEKTVCLDSRLATLDDRLERIWDWYLTAFDDEALRAAIEVEKVTWLQERDACRKDAACLGKTYEDRTALLSGKGPGRPLAGVFQSPAGELAVYPFAAGYLVSIRTSDPADGKWSCEAYGTGTGAAKKLAISLGALKTAAHLGDDGVMRVGDNAAATAVAQQYCGLNGTISFSYRPKPQKP